MSDSIVPSDRFDLEVLQLVNQERTTFGFQPLTLSEKLDTAADRHSQDMAANSYFDHTGRDGSSADQRIERAGYTNWNRWGENIAKGYRSPADVVRGWMNSPGHRANILKAGFTHMGLGYAVTAGVPGALYWTQVFAAGDPNPGVHSPTRTNPPPANPSNTPSPSQPTNPSPTNPSNTPSPSQPANPSPTTSKQSSTQPLTNKSSIDTIRSDRLKGSTGKDVLLGGGGNDRLYGKNSADRLDGRGGEDTLFGGTGNDTLIGGGGRDRLLAGSGNDLTYGNGGADKLYGHGGNDTLLGGSGNDFLVGGGNNDLLKGQGGTDTLVGGSGNDSPDWRSW